MRWKALPPPVSKPQNHPRAFQLADRVTIRLAWVVRIESAETLSPFKVNLADLVASAHLLRHSDAVAVAFAHSQGRIGARVEVFVYAMYNLRL